MARRKIKRTKFGRRAIAGARSGTGGIANPDGTRSSVRTTTFDIPGKGGRTDVAVLPTIRKHPKTGALTKLSPRAALAVAQNTGDYVRVRAKKGESIEQTRARADKMSQRFSKKLGRISARRKGK